MIHSDEIHKAIKYMHDSKPFHDMDDIQIHEKGLGATMVFLLKTEGEVKSVDISKHLEISSARMAVILRKLEHKHLITKSTSSTDSRAITILLTDTGKELACDLEQHMFLTVSKIIDTLGIDEFYKTFESLNTIKHILLENKPNIMEVLHD